MADRVLFGRGKLGERAVMTLGLEHGIESVADRPAHRPDDLPRHASYREFDVPIRPAECKAADEMGAPRRRRARSFKRIVQTVHRHDEVPAPVGQGRPVCRPDAGRTAEGIDSETGVVGERRKPGRTCRRQRLERGIPGERLLGLLRLGKAKVGRGKPGDPPRPEQGCQFLALPAGVGRKDDPIAGEAPPPEP